MAAAAIGGLLLAEQYTGSAKTKREFRISAHRYAYQVSGADKPELHVQQGDLVTVTFSVDDGDIPHSFTIEEPYRISKRAQPGKPVTFEFLADKLSPPEGFPIKCTLAIDDRCREMIARLFVVEQKK